MEMSAASLSNHLATQHDTYFSRIIDKDLGMDCAPVVYYATPSGPSGKYFCPVGQCVGQAYSNWNLGWHFHDCHPLGLVSIPGEGIYPRRVSCGRQTIQQALATLHGATKMCRVGTERREHREAAACSACPLDMVFTAYNVELERVEAFKYLGCLLTMDDNNI